MTRNILMNWERSRKKPSRYLFRKFLLLSFLFPFLFPFLSLASIITWFFSASSIVPLALLRFVHSLILLVLFFTSFSLLTSPCFCVPPLIFSSFSLLLSPLLLSFSSPLSFDPYNLYFSFLLPFLQSVFLFPFIPFFSSPFSFLSTADSPLLHRHIYIDPWPPKQSGWWRGFQNSVYHKQRHVIKALKP